MTGNSNIRILITDDHQPIRQSLKSLLQSKSGLEVIGEAENGLIAVEMANRLCPDVVLMDVSMPQLGGIDATRRVKQARRETVVIAMSMHSDEFYIHAMMEAGASDYLQKTASSTEIEHSIRKAVSRRDGYQL